ncbi:MAG: hypothetical protein ACXWDN_04795 [Limisphaerales bacterium]
MANRHEIGCGVYRVTICLVLIFALFISAANATAQQPSLPKKDNLYDSNPNHLWNRLHRTVFIRTDGDGTEYGFDELEPLLWSGSKYLLEGERFERCKQVLDEFIAGRGEKLITDPVKRAILQRDLWAVFDWTAHRDRLPEKQERRRALQTRLATVISRIALTKAQIKKLPDNYAKAVKTHHYAADFDEADPNTPFLPTDLLATNGAWICVGLNGDQSIAPSHRTQFGGRSVFFVFMRTPGTREETSQYLVRLRSFPQPWVYKIDTNVWENMTTHVRTSNQPIPELNSDLPQFPTGTTFALVRQAILIDDSGQPVASPLTESVQIRRYLDVTRHAGSSRDATPTQAFCEFIVSREQLFHEPSASLRSVNRGEKQFMHFMSKGFDPFDGPFNHNEPVAKHMPRALDCMTCHSGRGIQSVNSFINAFHERTLYLPSVAALDANRERDITVDWKQSQFSWGLFKGLQP